MSFNAAGQYVPNFKVWDHFGRALPDTHHSEGIVPAVETHPAPWLPVRFQDKHYENWVVIMVGKIVALDPMGYLMPAQYGLTSQTVVYTTNDVTAGTIDIATGLPVTAAKTVTLSNLSGVRGAGWTAANAGVSVTSGFMGISGLAFDDATAKYPVGVANQPQLQWAGGDGWDPTGLNYHNFNMQHQTGFLCDYVLRLPVIPGQEASESLGAVATVPASGVNVVFGTTGLKTNRQAEANATGRYDEVTGEIPVLNTYPVIAIVLDEQNLAKNTARTTISLASDNTADDVSGILVTEKSALSGVAAAGDFFVDYLVGVVFIYSADGSTAPAALSGAAGTVSITYYRYGTAPSVTSEFCSVLAGSGALVPGDFVKCGAGSNFVKADPSTDGYHILGQIVGFETHPRDALDRVRTAWDPAINTDASGTMSNGVAGSASVNLGQLDQMPGSASGGYPASIHYAGAADKLAIVNLISR